MDFNKVVMERRSIRKFTDYYVTDEELNELMDYVRMSPSWVNFEGWKFVSIRDRKNLDTLCNEVYPNNKGGVSATKSASVVLACMYDTTKSGFYRDISFNQVGTWGMFDLGIACQTLSLKLHEMGLGSVMIGAYDLNKAESFINAQKPWQLALFIAIGKPDQTPNSPKRKEINDIFESFEK